MTSRTVTGVCIPCASCGDAAKAAIAYGGTGDTIKMGSSAGLWYCVVVFN